MTNEKHTPGPWRVSYERGTTQIRTADNESIMCDETYYPWVPDNPADWDLIAAAPDMLEALKSLRACIMETRGPDAHDAVKAADAAIAKAQGGE